jgi:hypothetical protein
MKNLFLFLILFSFYSFSQTQEEIDSYFNEIALKSEFSKTPRGYLLKWESPLVIYIHGDYTEDLKKELIKVCNELINLTGLNISLTEYKDSSNLFIYVGNSEVFTDIYKPKITVTKWADGYFQVSRSKENNHILNSGFIFISNFSGSYNDSIFPEIQKSTIREELTQSLGLFNDSFKYDDSIFYSQKWDPILEFSEIDKAVIRKLYQK